MKRISRNNFGNIFLIIPPHNIQCQIADYLDKKCSEIDTLAKIKQKNRYAE